MQEIAMSPQHPYQILLAEDNPADVTLVHEALEEHRIPCDLRVLKDGAQVISFIEQIDRDSKMSPPALLLLDMHLPKCDGEDVLRKLRSSERSALTPVILMTASPSPKDYERAQKHAALHYFHKPSELSAYMEFGRTIAEILSIAKNLAAGEQSPCKGDAA